MPLPICVTTPNLVSPGQTVYELVGKYPKIGERWGSPGVGNQTSALSMCYHVRLGRSASNGVRINRREPPKLGSTGAGPLDIYMFLRHMCYAEFGHFRSNDMSVIKEIAFQGQSRSSEPRRIDQ